MAASESRIAGRVIVYSMPGCPHCLQAKSTLGSLGLPVWDINVAHDAALRARLKELTGSSTVPHIFFNNVYVGRNEHLQNLSPEALERLVHMVREEPVPSNPYPLPAGTSPETEERDGGGLYIVVFSPSPSVQSVDYRAMSKSPWLERYCEWTLQLQQAKLLSLSREEKLAFFINVYNALVIHGNLRLSFPKTMWQRYRFFNYVSYLIGGEVFTLQDIENGVLRGNRKGVTQLLKPFSNNDPRLQVALPEVEPLIHFALNHGVKGCPPIKVYSPQDIKGQLHSAAEAFLESSEGCVVDYVKREVKLSQIFKWYKVDFGGADEKLLNWVVDHMGESEKKSRLKILLSAGNVKVSYLLYDWSTNSTD
uniref:Glutaredoxin domain-containing protein n=1 Tax=Electrophorus electricus TaxID=8005 RepID=A0A4W4EH91_ELEEL